MEHGEIDILLTELKKAYETEGGSFQTGLAYFAGFATAQLCFLMSGGSINIAIDTTQKILEETLARINAKTPAE